MLVGNDIYKQIDDIVERSYTGFIFDILGKDFLTPEQQLQAEALGLLVGRKSLIELLYLLVRQRSEERYHTTRQLTELLDEIAATGVLDRLPKTAQATIDNAAESLNNIISRTQNEIKSRIKSEIVKINKEETVNESKEANRLELVPIAPFINKKRQQKQVNKLMIAVGAGLLLANKAFHSEFTNELTDLVNNAAVDSGLASATGRSTLAFKKIVNDSHLCKWCHSAYVNPDGTPKIYKLKDLIKNGSNEGRPKSQWKPVVGPHHIRCRCSLILISPDQIK